MQVGLSRTQLTICLPVLIMAVIASACDILGLGGKNRDTVSDGALSARSLAFSRHCNSYGKSTDDESHRTVYAVIQAVGATSCQEAVQKLFEVDSLDLSYRKLTDLSPLRGLPLNIERIDLEGNYIESLDPISQTNLREVRLINNPTMDLSPLLALDLVYLAVDQLNQRQYDSFSAMPNLVSLELKSIELLSDGKKVNLSKLKTINFECRDCNISDLNQLSLSTSLQRLVIDSKKLSSLQGIEKYTNLEELYIYSDGVTDISQISSLTKLRKLFIRGLSTDNLAPLANLRNLSELEIKSNFPVLSIGALSNLNKLSIVQILNVTIDSLDPFLTSRDNLIELSILDSPADINDVSALASFEKLRLLILPNIPVDFEGSSLSSLADLYYFECRCVVNQSVLQALGQMQGLQYLRLGNRLGLDDLDSLAGLDLRLIGIDTNALSSLDELFIRFPNLQTLVLYDPLYLSIISPEYSSQLTSLLVFFRRQQLQPNIFNNFVGFPNLTSLTLYSADPDIQSPIPPEEFGSLAGLEGLGLSKLELKGLQIDNASFLAKLPNIRNLSLRETGITSLQSLVNSDLKVLNVSDSGVGYTVQKNPTNCPKLGVIPWPMRNFCME